MSSVVLQGGVKEMLIEDCKDFLRSEDWCVLLQSSHHFAC
jgi:chaperone BCS1